MKEEHGNIDGDYTVTERTTLWGTVAGTVTVLRGGKLWARGLIHGDLVIKHGGRAHLFGVVSGEVETWPESKAILSGTVGRDAINRGGRMYLDKSANVMGKVLTFDGGKTEIDGVRQ